MKKLIFIIAFLQAVFCAYAQQSSQDVLYLKNGSIIRGTIIEQVPNKSLKIQTADGSVFVYSIEEVEKITKEVATTNSTETTKSFAKTSGYVGIIEASHLVYVGKYSTGSLSGFRFVNAIQTSSAVSLGLGAGLNFGSGGAIEAPLFFDLRANFMKGNVTPFWLLNAGYCLAVNNVGNKSSIMGGSGLGVKIYFAPKLAWLLHAGYELRVLPKNGELFNFIGLRTGLSF
jgi:hypothetical protein